MWKDAVFKDTEIVGSTPMWAVYGRVPDRFGKRW